MARQPRDTRRHDGLIDAAAVTGLAAWRRDEHGVIAQVLTWVCLVVGVMWTLIVVGETVGGA